MTTPFLYMYYEETVTIITTPFANLYIIQENMIIGQLKMESIVQLIPEQFPPVKSGIIYSRKMRQKFPTSRREQRSIVTDRLSKSYYYLLNNHLQEKTLSWIYYLCTFCG